MRSQIFEFDADIKHNENRQGSKYKRYRIYYSPLVLLERVLDLGAAPLALKAGLGLGTVLSLPPSLLLVHDSDRGAV